MNDRAVGDDLWREALADSGVDPNKVHRFCSRVRTVTAATARRPHPAAREC